MARIRVELFGPGRLSVDGVPVRLHSSKVLALLAYLVTEPRAHSRHKLASLLWSCFGESSARKSLRQALHSLRQVAGEAPGWLHSQSDSVTLGGHSQMEVDVDTFARLCASPAPQDWKAAAQLARAPFLEGLEVSGGETFDEWLAARREHLHALASRNLVRLVDHSIEACLPDEALHWLEQLRRHAPEQEAACAAMTRTLASARDPEEARTAWADWSRAWAAGDRLPVPRRSASAPAPAQAPAGDHAAPAAWLYRAGRSAERVHAFAEALEMYGRARQRLEARTPVDEAALGEVLLAHARALERLGRHREAAQAAQACLAQARRLGEVGQVAALLLVIAPANTALGDHLRACAAAREAAELFRQDQDVPGEAEALRELGFTLWHAGDPVQALGAARQVRALHRSLGDAAGETSAMHNVAELLRDRGLWAQACALYADVLRRHEAAGNGLGAALAMLGQAQAQEPLGGPAAARATLQGARTLAAGTGDGALQARCLHALARLHRVEGRTAEGLACIREAVEIDRRLHQSQALAHALVEAAALHRLRGEVSQARAALEEAVAWAEYIGDAALMRAAGAAALDAPATAAPARRNAPTVVRGFLQWPEGKVYSAYPSGVDAVTVQPESAEAKPAWPDASALSRPSLAVSTA